MKLLKWVLIAIMAVIVGAFLLVSFTIIMFVHSWSNGVKPDFIAYEPKVPLAGWDITEVSKKNGANNGKSKPSFKQTYSSGVVLTQTKIERSSTPLACEEPPTVHPSNANNPMFQDVYNCRTGNIKNDGAYAVTTIFHGGELDRVEVRARLGEASMYFYIPDEAQAQMAEYTEWQSYFDSMQPVDL